MSRVLRMNDMLCAPGSHDAVWQVVDATPRDGWVKLFGFEQHQEEYQRISAINDALVAGELVLRQKAAPRVTAAAQNDSELDERLRIAMRQVRVIETLKRKFKVSTGAAYEMTRAKTKLVESDVPLASRATIFRYMKAKQNGMPLLRGPKNKGNR